MTKEQKQAAVDAVNAKNAKTFEETLSTHATALANARKTLAQELEYVAVHYGKDVASAQARLRDLVQPTPITVEDLFGPDTLAN